MAGLLARPELVCEPLEGVREADTEGAEALAVALKGNLKGGCAAVEEVIEEVPLIELPKLGQSFR